MKPLIKDTVVRGHFGEWLQGLVSAGGPVALVTLVCPALSVRAATSPKRYNLPISATQFDKFKAILNSTEDWPALQSNIPPGCGAGASTATLVALARAIGFAGSASDLASACVEVEGATDPLMFDRPDSILWASRSASILRQLAPPPRCEVVGGFWGPPQRTIPSDIRFPDISDLIAPWEIAVTAGSLAKVAALASVSADRCTQLRGPADPMSALAKELGALGHIRAHTGSARGLVFAPNNVPEHAEATLSEAGLKGVIRFETGDT